MAATAAALRQSALGGSIGLHQQDNVVANRQPSRWVNGICRCRAGMEHPRNNSFPTQPKHYQPSRSCSLVLKAAAEASASTQELPPTQSEVEGKGAEAKEAEAKPEKPAKPTLKKGQVVRVDKDMYYDSVESLATNHPRNYKGIDYVFEDRGEILDVRIFQAGEYALVAWSGVLTAPAWLPASMLTVVEKNTYKRIYGP
ncbi:Ndh-O [Klebsormidium nitens]|uniref:Ndh-O n=1 Tax=Klebsormidium nitens TaxID=105231 RepID=A0A0U9HTJ9_KLENI|nr:Ndh-O [Klebsormidium nitens]|eukprot:GAQ88276.1 Ndh-O [Klebsormidium nitens]